MQFKAPRGTSDILPEERPYWRLVESMAEKISENAPLSLASIKKSINTFEDSQKISENHYSKIKESILKAANSMDYIEAQNAFKSKRKPKFQGN